MKIYFVLRAQRGYDYEDKIDRNSMRDDYNNDKNVHNEFLNYWNGLFKKSYNQVRKELKNLVLENISSANFDKVYLSIDDFHDDYSNILLEKNDEDIFVLFMDDDDFIKPDICKFLKNNYFKGFDGITWNYIRYHGIKNCIYSANSPKYTGYRDGKMFVSYDLIYAPWPHIQSNHCILKIPLDNPSRIGTWWEEYQLSIPINHSCIHSYLYEHNTNRKVYNIAQSLSLHNTTPASYSFYGVDYKIGGRDKDVFDDPNNFYKCVKRFVYDNPEGSIHLLDDEFNHLLKKQRNIFKECL